MRRADAAAISTLAGGRDAGRPVRRLILAKGRASRNYWADLWAFRELFLILAWRDIAVRYKQSVIGVGWAVLRPLLTMIVFTVVFGRVAGLPSEGGVAYPVMVFAGMLPWFLFASILTEAAQTLVANAGMVRKVYFPRVIAPAASAMVALVDFAIALVLMFGLMALFAVVPDGRVVLLPAFVLLALAASFGPALLLTALNVRYRDFRFVVPFIVQFGLYVSPVGFSSGVVAPEWRLLYSLNPMVSVIDGFRFCLLGADVTLYLPGLALGVLVSAAFLWLGFAVFRRTEATFADLV
ncbi:ABC transporter permease [Acuticoccus sp. I52.16.1]|uniref:ABC transporter permease n=1 Tax=Acuticoccus sp. I52.16.1 TaxID=2928472 RepID=UPI001FCF9EB1|nr:ABC transporter permease [Acuticoccus sp. I52.16.1]UOM37189.1 ABC transporter permease [Acuticoccus sp. I52.16.1]